MAKIRRKVVRADTEAQLGLFSDAGNPLTGRRRQVGKVGREDLTGDGGRRRFTDPDPDRLFLGGERLGDFLRRVGEEFPVFLREFLREADLSFLEESYPGKGRPSYSPAAMLGLVVYGLWQGKTSVRELRSLARRDLGAMYVTGGIMPDHSVICRFILRHASDYEELFERVTRRVLESTGTDTSSLAVDGTSFRAACSRLGMLEADAAGKYADKAEEELEEALREKERREASDEGGTDDGSGRADADGEQTGEEVTGEKLTGQEQTGEESESGRSENEGKSDGQGDGDHDSGEDGTDPKEDKSSESPEIRRKRKKAETARKAATEVDERNAARKAKGRKNPDNSKISPTEPDAFRRQDKEGVMAPTYIGSLMVTNGRIITGCAVDPTSETDVLDALFEENGKITGRKPEELYADSGYFCEAVLRKAVEEDISLLCPEGRTSDKNWCKKARKKFPKSMFEYDEKEDVYICPAGEKMRRADSYAGKGSIKGYVHYVTNKCPTCPYLAKCTTSKKKRRKIKRYACDELKDAQRKVMRQPRAREAYSWRQHTVEPVFGELRHRQGLTRFRRRGLDAVRTELRLHAFTHNIGRAFHLGRRKRSEARKPSFHRLFVPIFVPITAHGRPLGAFGGLPFRKRRIAA